jgi:hypothetical protein
MRNAERWTESKYIWRKGRLIGSRDKRELGVGSRLISDRIAALYQKHLPTYMRGHLVDLGCGKVPLYAAYCSFASQISCVDWPQSPHDDLHVDHAVDLASVLHWREASSCKAPLILSLSGLVDHRFSGCTGNAPQRYTYTKNCLPRWRTKSWS